MIRMNVGEKDAVDIPPLDRQSFQRARQRVETSFGLHASVDQQPARFQPDQVHVHDTQREGKRKFHHVDAGNHLPVIAADFEVRGQGAILPQCLTG